MDILKELLHKGYFPIQLPPSFTSKQFADKYKNIAGHWNSQKPPASCHVEKFSVARSSYYRRVTSILNPVGYYFLVKEIVQYWPQIQKHYKKSKFSLSKPDIDPSLRAIKISRFSDLYEEKIIKSTGYRYTLITDISGFFPTIYTHTIPWALHGKSIAKKHRDNKPTYYGNILDKKCREVQDGQTIGLPIGPDTSHIIAEIIATSIDNDIKEGLGYWPQGFRYVDDFYLFFDKREEAEKALSEVIKAVGNYELQINPSKTKIIEVKDIVEESWKYSIKKFSLSERKKKQREDIHNYFEQLLETERKFKDESIVKYGLKQISSYIIKRSNWDIFESYLLKCGFGFPNTLQIISLILYTYNKYKFPLKKLEIERFCDNLILSHAISNYHNEVAWLLWLCKELQLNVSEEAIREIEKMSSSICSLIILDMCNSGQIKINLQEQYLKQFTSKDCLYQSNWLLSYEAGRRKWLHNNNTSYIENDSFFKELIQNDVSFYDSETKCKPIFEFKKNDENLNLELFDEEDPIEQYFEFDEMDDEYFDSDEEEDE